MKKFILNVLILIPLLSVAAPRLFPIQKKGKWGYMDIEGKMVIDFKYDLAGDFNEGYASVALNRMPCLIDLNEKRVIDTGIYQYIGMYSEGLVPVLDYKYKRYYLDNKGKVAITLEEDIYDAGVFRNGLARVGKKVDIKQNKFGFDISNLGYKFTFIRKDGSYLTDFIFDDADDFFESVTRVMQGTKFGLLDKTGNLVVEPKYSNMSDFMDGIAVVELTGKFGYIDTTGMEIVKPQYEYAKAFSNGLAAVSINGKFGFINLDNQLVIPAKYEDVRPYSEGRVGVFELGKWAFLDSKGTYIYQPYFEEVAFFNEGLCPVKLKGKYGAIDLTGRVVVPFQFEFIGVFEDGVAEIIMQGIPLYVDLRGNILPRL